MKEYDKVTCIDALNKLLALLFGKGDNEDDNDGDDELDLKLGRCVATDVLNFWNSHKIVWACDQSQFGMEDEYFFYPLDISNWLIIAYDCLDNCPPYTSNSAEEVGFDCDDFADALPAWSKMFYGVNAIWEVWGDTPQGGHAWNAMMTDDGMYELEPQTGEVWVFGTKPEYKASIAK